MKPILRIAVLLLALISLAQAGRPTTDEVAVRLGVAEWSRSQPASTAHDVRIAWRGGLAVTTFSLRPQTGTESPTAPGVPVTLTWEKCDGVWLVVPDQPKALAKATP